MSLELIVLDGYNSYGSGGFVSGKFRPCLLFATRSFCLSKMTTWCYLGGVRNDFKSLKSSCKNSLVGYTQTTLSRSAKKSGFHYTSNHEATSTQRTSTGSYHHSSASFFQDLVKLCQMHWKILKLRFFPWMISEYELNIFYQVTVKREVQLGCPNTKILVITRSKIYVCTTFIAVRHHWFTVGNLLDLDLVVISLW